MHERVKLEISEKLSISEVSLASRIVLWDFCSDDELKADYRHSQKYSLFLVKIYFLKRILEGVCCKFFP